MCRRGAGSSANMRFAHRGHVMTRRIARPGHSRGLGRAQRLARTCATGTLLQYHNIHTGTRVHTFVCSRVWFVVCVGCTATLRPTLPATLRPTFRATRGPPCAPPCRPRLGRCWSFAPFVASSDRQRVSRRKSEGSGTDPDGALPAYHLVQVSRPLVPPV